MNEVLTFQELVSHVLDVADMQGDGVELRRAIRSAKWGFEQASTRHRWTTYDTETVFAMHEPVTGISVDVTESGVVTLSGDVWPDWAEFGTLATANSVYRVKERVDDTTLQLENWTGKSETGLDVRLLHNRVIIPHDVRTVFAVWDEIGQYRLHHLDPVKFRDRDRWTQGTSGAPAYYTMRRLMRDGRLVTEMRITPATSVFASFHVSYLRNPAQPKMLHAAGRVSSSGGSVTFTQPLPPQLDPTGAWIRISTTETSPEGNLASSLFHPAEIEWQGPIESKTSDTVVEVPGVPDVSNRGAIVTDILDLPWYAFNAAKLYAEAQMFRQGLGQVLDFRRLREEADEMMRYAMEMDGPSTRSHTGVYFRGETFEPFPYLEG